MICCCDGFFGARGKELGWESIGRLAMKLWDTLLGAVSVMQGISDARCGVCDGMVEI